MSSGSRVSIPNNVRKIIQNIKEISGNHSDDEIYAMLKDCSMDPNETAQKLLFQDTFHEVKRRREKRKENLNSNKDSTDSRWRPGTQGRGSKGGRGNYLPRGVSYDAGGGRIVGAGKENGVSQGPEGGVTPYSLSASQDTESKTTTPPMSSSVNVVANGPTGGARGRSPHGRASELPAGSGTNTQESSAANVSKLGSTLPPPPPVNAKSTPPGVGINHGQHTPDHITSPVSVLGVYSSASDPVLVPSLDSRPPGAVGTIKREVGSQRTSIGLNDTNPQDSTNCLQINKVVSRNVTNSELSSSMDEKTASEIENSFMHGKMPSKAQGVERIQFSESLQLSSSTTHGGTLTSRPSSNYGSRAQQLIGSQKGPSKEWKPKPINPTSAPPIGTVGRSEVVPISVEAGSCSLPSSGASTSEEATSKLQKKLEELHFLDNQNVIIPNHLQVPEAERTRLSFGSFDASFVVNKSYANGPDTENSSTSLSESSQGIEEISEEPSSSNQNVSSVDHEGDYPDHPQSPMNAPEDLSPVEADASSNAVPEYDHSKPDTVLTLGGPQYSVVHPSPNYSSFGLMPPLLGTQFPPFDSSELQARDGSRLPSFVVQQPFDPSTSYYTQFYRPSADGDGRFSPFLAPGTATKYNGNVPMLSPQSGQSPQESGNALVLSTAGSTPLATQATGVMQQSSVAMTQQPIPVFRQPAGVHLSHYPPPSGYIPYNQYFPPFYVSPTIHHFLSNTTFPQQPLTGNVYPAPAAAAATGVKYSPSQFKPGTNTSNSTNIGMPTGYAPYNSHSDGYSPNPSTTTGNSTGNEDLAASQYKENNVYITGQQSEGSAVWIPTPGRDISGLQASSFYNISPQGQHVTFAPTQAGHGATFAGIYHPAQTVAAAAVHPLLQQSQTMAGGPVEMVGSSAGVYQQPQLAQVNWTNNY